MAGGIPKRGKQPHYILRYYWNITVLLGLPSQKTDGPISKPAGIIVTLSVWKINTQLFIELV